MLICRVRWTGLSTIKEIRMIGTLSQVHQNVHQSHFSSALVATSVKDVDILQENLLVPVLLHLRHWHVNVDQFFGKEGLFYICLFRGSIGIFSHDIIYSFCEMLIYEPFP